MVLKNKKPQISNDYKIHFEENTKYIFFFRNKNIFIKNMRLQEKDERSFH